MGDAGDQPTTLLQGLGLFKIWTTIIVAPLIMVAVVVGMIVIAQYQRGWTVSTAKYSTTGSEDNYVRPTAHCSLSASPQTMYTCTVDVTVEKLPKPTDSYYSLVVESASNDIKDGQSWTVAYDPANPSTTLTTGVMTNSAKVLLESVLALILVIAVAFFMINIVFRRNKTWQNISGVTEVAGLASSVVSSFR